MFSPKTLTFPNFNDLNNSVHPNEALKTGNLALNVQSLHFPLAQNVHLPTPEDPQEDD